MINFTYKNLSQSAVYALTASLVIVSMLFVGYFVAEPTISYGQAATETFTIRQTIVDESSFLVAPANVTMVGDLNGVTGGNATGTTSFVVTSNNSAGYYVEIDYFDNGTDVALLGDATASEALRNYQGGNLATPTFGFSASTSSQFAYTITSSTSADTGDLFLNNGAACGVGTNQNSETCWMSPSTTAIRIVDRDSAAVNGASSTLQFRVHVPNAAVPVPQAETYTATATLSLFVK